MLTKSGVALTFYAFFVASKTGKTGLTVTLDVYETTSGTPIVSAGSATELGGGLYYYTLASGSVDASGAYVAVFKTADSSVDQQHIPALWVTDTELKNLDAAVSTRSTVTTAQVNAEVDSALADVGLTTTVTGRIDAAISSRNAVAPLDATATQAAAAAALTAYDPATGAEVAALPDAILDDEEVSAGVSVRTALAAAGSAADPLLNTVPGSYASGTAGHALGRIANGQLTIVQPVLDDGFFRIVPGRDYLADDGMAFTFSSTSWPTLPAGTTVEFIFGDEVLTGERTGDQAVRLEVTAAQGTALAEARSGRQHYDIVATLPSNSVIGLAENAPVLVG